MHVYVIFIFIRMADACSNAARQDILWTFYFLLMINTSSADVEQQMFRLRAAARCRVAVTPPYGHCVSR